MLMKWSKIPIKKWGNSKCISAWDYGSSIVITSQGDIGWLGEISTLVNEKEFDPYFKITEIVDNKGCLFSYERNARKAAKKLAKKRIKQERSGYIVAQSLEGDPWQTTDIR